MTHWSTTLVSTTPLVLGRQLRHDPPALPAESTAQSDIVAPETREFVDDAATKEVRASRQVAHVTVVYLVGGNCDRLVTMGRQTGRPHVEGSRIMRPQQLNSLHREAGVLGKLDDILFGWQLAAGENLPADETHELQITQRDCNPRLVKVVHRVSKDRVQKHSAVVGQNTVCHVEKCCVARFLECLERSDAHDAVDGLVKLLPALQPHLHRARRRNCGQPLDAVLTLVAAQRDTDDVDVVLLYGELQRAAPPASDVEQRHPRLEAELSQRQIELGVLRLFQRHVVAFEIGTRVAHGWAKEQGKELIRYVVNRLGFFVVRRKFGWDF